MSSVRQWLHSERRNHHNSHPETIQENDPFTVQSEIEASWQEEGVTYYKYKITITNNDEEPCSSWDIQLTFNQEFQLSDSWNGNYTIDGTNLTVSSLDYNGEINAHDSYNDIGFIVYGASSLSLEE